MAKLVMQLLLLLSVIDDEKQSVVLLLLLSITSLIQIFDFGFTTTFSRLISFAAIGKVIDRRGNLIDASKYQALIDTLKVSSKVYKYTSLISTSLVLALTIAPMQSVMQGNNAQDHLWYVYLSTIVASALYMYSNKYVSLITGLDKIEVYKKNELVCQIITLSLISVLYLFSTSGLFVVVLYNTYIASIAFVNRYTAKKVLSRALRGDKSEELVENDHLDVIKYALKSAWKSGLGVLLSQGLLQYSSFYVAQHADYATAGAYVFTLRFFTAVMQVANIPFYNRLPRLANLFVTNRAEAYGIAKVKMIHSALTYAVFSAIGLQSYDIIAMKLQINQRTLEGMVILLLGSGMIIERVNGMLMQLYTLSNDIVWHKINALYFISTVLLFMLFEKKYDMIVSISLSLALVSLFVILPLLVYLNKRVFEVKMNEIVMIAAIPVVVYVLLSML